MIAFALFAGSIGLWMARMSRVALEGRRALPFAMCAGAVVVGSVALFDEPGWTGGALAVVGIAGGLVWIGLGLLAGQSRQTPRIAVGEPLPAIVALDHTGMPFDVEHLRGHPVLIKLFRGHW